MTSPSSSYRDLKTKLKETKSILQRVPDNQCITRLHHLKVQSYVLLSHAAFEEYLESLSESIIQESVHRYNTNRTINQCVVGLVTFETIAQFDKTSSRKVVRADVVKNLDKFVNLARSNHLADIQGNNGIKGHNQRTLFLPLGIDPEDIDPVTYAALDSFGQKRGGLAHRFKTQTTETKSSILLTTKTIFTGLLNLDQEACSVLSNHMRLQATSK